MQKQTTPHKTARPNFSPWLGTLTGWFSKPKPVAQDTVGESTQGFSRMEATRPVVSQREQAQVDKAQTKPVASVSSVRAQRLARRDQIFQLVRESMVRSGVLSSGYKFKVLSLDQRGAQFMVMMDLAAEFGGQTDRLAEIEALIAQTAKHRYNVMVQAVYWRFSDHVVLGRPAERNAMIAEPVRIPAQCYEPLLEDEVAAFKRALAAGVLPMPAKSMPTKRSGLLLTGYEDTEVADENAGMPVLSATQYGDLPLH